MKLLTSVEGHSDRVWMAKWSPDGRLLASASTDKSVRIWALLTNNEGAPQLRCISVLEGVHQRTIRAVDWSPNGKFLACCSFDGTVSVWTRCSSSYSAEQDVDQVEYECIATLEGHENEVKAVAWSRDGTLLATCGRDKSVWIWETESEGEFECLAVLNGHSQDVKSVVWHPTNRILFSCSYDDTIKVWAEEDMDWCCVNTLKAHDSTVWNLSFLPSGTQFVSVGDDCKMFIWDAVPQNDEGKELEKWVQSSSISGVHGRTIYSVSCNVQGLIATGSGENAIRVFQSKVGANPILESTVELLEEVKNAHEGDVNHVLWHPFKSELLVSCGDDNLIKLWSVQ